ncbi:anti-sigma regulatory factor [Vibrio scophthalmi]|uniref:anti-sigma regulatory factor n=1 Tax=Vibrio scophthalmi TaxID=45658 RepID=UPI002FEE94AF
MAIPQQQETVLDSHVIHQDTDVMTAVMSMYTLAQQRGFTPPVVSELTTVVSELATNILKYASHGAITFFDVTDDTRSGLKITARDDGPGIEDIEQALTDSFSTGKTLGLGLPGIRRMVDEFDIDAPLGEGTQVDVVKWRR